MAIILREYTNFSGGIHQQIGPVVSEAQGGEAMMYAEDAQNMEMSTTGLLKMRGYAHVLNSALSGSPTITGIFDYLNAGTREMIVCAGGKVYKVSGGSAMEIYTGHTAGEFYLGTVYRDTLILCNGTDTPLIYDGSTCSLLSAKDPQSIWTSAAPKGVCVFRNRVFFWDDHKIYSPKPGTYDDFNNNDNTVDGFYIDRGYGGKITHVKPLTDDSLIIYKERCIRRLSGSAPFGQPDQFIIRPISDDVGCAAPRSVVQVGLDHYFWSERGPRGLRTVQSYGDVEIVQPSYLIPTIVDNVNWNQVENICSVYSPVDGKVIYCYPTGASTTNTDCLVWDADTQTNEPRGQGISAACLALYNRQVIHGDYAGQLYTHGTINSYDGSDIEAFWKSKYIAHNGIGTLKRYRRLVLFAQGEGNADITVRWSVLQRGAAYTQSGTVSIDSTANAWDSGEWSTAQWSTAEAAVFHVKNLGRGSAFKLELLNTSATQHPVIRQVSLEFEVFGTNMG